MAKKEEREKFERGEKTGGKGEVKEEFCGACVAGLGALAGIGTTATSTRVDKKKKRIVFWVGFSLTCISILILFYLLFVKKCSECM